jgi:tetratricopeptide (TPR) repeat protein
MLSLAPNLAESHAALSCSKYLEGNFLGAEEEIRRALKLNPDYATAHGLYCYYLSLLGRIEEANAHAKRAQEIEPTSRVLATVAGYPFVSARLYDQAIAQFHQALELDNQFPLAHLWIAKCHEALSNYSAAILEFETCDRLSEEEPTKVTQRYDALRHEFTEFGEGGYWLKVLEFARADEGVPDEQKRLTQHDRWDLAGIHARLGQNEKALDLLQKDFEENGGNDWLRLEPLYFGLRDEPRFKALLKRAGCGE